MKILGQQERLHSSIGKAVETLLFFVFLTGCNLRDRGGLPGETMATGARPKVEGTARVYAATVIQAATAITNALSMGRFHSALLVKDPFEDAAAKWGTATASNVWLIGPGGLPLTYVSKDDKMLPYEATFDVAVSPLGSNQCRILVKTRSSYVENGKEINIHGGGWATHSEPTPPLLEEETYIIDRIETQLRALQTGDHQPLPPSPDPRAEMEYMQERSMELNPHRARPLPPLNNTNNAPSGK
jgi:hypothetical protein